MRKSLIVIMGLIMVFTMTAGIFAAETSYKDGHYIGYVPNDHGDVVVEVVIERGQIVDVNMLNPFKLDYSYEPGKKAFLEWPYLVLKNQSTEIDVISGATHSTHDYQKATQMALDIASGKYKGNKYYGVAENFAHGHVLVEITVKGDRIEDARLITANPELLKKEDGREKLMPAKPDDYKSKPALKYFKEFPVKVVKNQGNVDGISGATHSAESYNAALDMAMEQAGLK